MERLKLTLPAGVSLQLSASRRQSFTPHSHVQRRRYQTIRHSRGLPFGLRKRTEKGTGLCVLSLIPVLVRVVSEREGLCLNQEEREWRISTVLKKLDVSLA